MSYPYKFVIGSYGMKIRRLFVDEKCIRYPDIFNKFRTNGQRFDSGLFLKRQPRIRPKLSEIEIQREVLRTKLMSIWIYADRIRLIKIYYTYGRLQTYAQNAFFYTAAKSYYPYPDFGWNSNKWWVKFARGRGRFYAYKNCLVILKFFQYALPIFEFVN